MNSGGPLIYAGIACTLYLLAGLLTFWWVPDARLSSIIKHFAAGMVAAAVTIDLVPPLLERHALWATIAGFTIGAALMIGVRLYTQKVEGGEASQKQQPARPAEGGSAEGGYLQGSSGQSSSARGSSAQGGSPEGGEHYAGSFSLVFTIGVDMLIDGTLLGVTGLLEHQGGLLLAVALAGEFVSLSLSGVGNYAAQLGSLGMRLGVIGGTAVLPFLGTLAAVNLLPLAPEVYRFVALAAGVPVFVYLVVEELISEAHDQPTTLWGMSMLFVGYTALIVLDIARRLGVPSA